MRNRFESMGISAARDVTFSFSSWTLMPAKVLTPWQAFRCKTDQPPERFPGSHASPAAPRPFAWRHRRVGALRSGQPGPPLSGRPSDDATDLNSGPLMPARRGDAAFVQACRQGLQRRRTTSPQFGDDRGQISSVLRCSLLTHADADLPSCLQIDRSQSSCRHSSGSPRQDPRHLHCRPRATPRSGDAPGVQLGGNRPE